MALSPIVVLLILASPTCLCASRTFVETWNVIVALTTNILTSETPLCAPNILRRFQIFSPIRRSSLESQVRDPNRSNQSNLSCRDTRPNPVEPKFGFAIEFFPWKPKVGLWRLPSAEKENEVQYYFRVVSFFFICLTVIDFDFVLVRMTLWNAAPALNRNRLFEKLRFIISKYLLKFVQNVVLLES